MSYNTIKVKKYSDNIEELVAAAEITPGQLVEVTSAGKVQRHSTDGGNVIPVKFALEDELQGKEISDKYAADDPVQVWTPYSGDIVYAILEDGETVSIGDPLQSAGNGNLKKHNVESEEPDYLAQIVAIAREAKDLSGSSGEESSGIQGDQRIIVEVR
jgi:hypothetical protein